MPGSPTDPDHVLAAIAAGCAREEERLTFETLKLGLVATEGVWHLSTAGTIGVSADTFALLEQGEASVQPPGYVRIGRLLYALEPVEGMAELQPA